MPCHDPSHARLEAEVHRLRELMTPLVTLLQSMLRRGEPQAREIAEVLVDFEKYRREFLSPQGG